MRTNDYIQATSSLLSDGKEFNDVIKRLKTVLDEKGHQKLFRSILLGLQRKTERTISDNVATVSVARKKDLKDLKDKINNSLSEIEAKDFQASVDETIIGGFVVEHDNKIIDKSYKSRLVALYRSLIN
jgi:F0F1-type ATP synthase delta subunit